MIQLIILIIQLKIVIELFYDYLLTNLKLYFDKFEDELAPSLEEPTTPEYEAEKRAEEASAEEIPTEI